jgi:hypothetical protein
MAFQDAQQLVLNLTGAQAVKHLRDFPFGRLGEVVPITDIQIRALSN